MTFFKSLLSNLVSIFIFFTLIIGLIIFIVFKVSQPDEVIIDQNSVLHLVLDGELKDQSESQEFSFKTNPTLCLTDLDYILNTASKDIKIKALYIEIGNLSAGVASWERLRLMLQKFKTSGKPIVCYAENLTLLNYYAISVADEIILHPLGYLEWKGLSAQMIYFKSLLKTIGVEVVPIKVGKYKSAIEPFILDSISEENEYQINQLIGDLWTKIKKDVSISRSISENKLNQFADSMGVLIASEAKSSNLITQIAHRDYIEEYFKKRFNDYKFAKIDDYESTIDKLKSHSGPKIVVVYADGVISGNEESEDVSPAKFQKIFSEISEDTDVKGVVIRINSPGGSASVSETIWRQIDLLKQKIPVYVSMGEVAASGGYYIAAAADSIFAENTTITGSIGVYGLLFNLEALKNKVGISVQKVNTNLLSDFPAFDRPMSNLEKKRMQMGVDSIYYLFLKRVAQSRKMTIPAVHELAQGRVWTGAQALNIGLVDNIKSLQQTVDGMSKKLKLNDYQIVEYPVPESPLEKIIHKIDNKVELKLPEPFSYVYEIGKYLEICQNFRRPQCQLPFVLTIQ